MGMGRLSEGNKGVNIIKVHYMYWKSHSEIQY
jgi:hypothetical protein